MVLKCYQASPELPRDLVKTDFWAPLPGILQKDWVGQRIGISNELDHTMAELGSCHTDLVVNKANTIWYLNL